MTALNRYILKELFRSFFFTLIVFTAILVLIMVAREAVSRGVPPLIALRMVPYFLPEQLRISIPVTLLLATTTFFARMSGSNEFTALKALGIPPWKVLWPTFFASIFISLITVWLNDFSMTYGREGIARVMVQNAEDYIYGNLRTNHILAPKGAGFSIEVKGVENKRLLSPVISIRGITISAQWAEIRMDYSNENITIVLHHLYGEDGSGLYISRDRHEETIALSSIIPASADAGRIRPSEMQMKDIPQEIAKQEGSRSTLRNQLAANAAFSACLGDFQAFSAPAWKEREQSENAIQEMMYRLNLEPPRRWSTGFTCFFFVWVGAPFAIWMRKSDIFASFFACFIPILILYYPLLTLGTIGGKNGTFPPTFIWSGNIVLGIIGVWFLRQIHRY